MLRPCLASAVLLLALAAPTLATGCVPTTSDPEYDTKLVSEATGQPRYYGDDDGILIVVCCDMISFWIYEETNGIDGLQRADEVVDDTCRGAIRGDTIIF